MRIHTLRRSAGRGLRPPGDDLPQLLDAHIAHPQHPRAAPGDVDDRGGHGLAAGPAVQVDRHGSPSCSIASSTSWRRQAAAVRTAHRHRAGGGSAARWPPGAAASGPRPSRRCRRGPSAATAGPRTMVSPPGQNPSTRSRAALPMPGAMPSSVRGEPTRTGTGMSRPRPFASSRPPDGLGVERVGAQPVDRVGREHDELAVRHVRRGEVQPHRPLRRDVHVKTPQPAHQPTNLSSSSILQSRSCTTWVHSRLVHPLKSIMHNLGAWKRVPGTSGPGRPWLGPF